MNKRTPRPPLELSSSASPAYFPVLTAALNSARHRSHPLATHGKGCVRSFRQRTEQDVTKVSYTLYPIPTCAFQFSNGHMIRLKPPSTRIIFAVSYLVHYDTRRQFVHLRALTRQLILHSVDEPLTFQYFSFIFPMFYNELHPFRLHCMMYIIRPLSFTICSPFTLFM